MEFNSLIFLFFFLPLLLLTYYILNPRFRNIYLAGASLFFYAWGQKEAVFILIFLIILNYFLSLKISGSKSSGRSKKIYIIAVLLNISVLVFYKYLSFFLGIAGIEFKLAGIPYPTGISFMTFLAISYLTDIYRKSVEFKSGILSYTLYLSLFPKVITGPITIWSKFRDQLEKRDITIDDFSRGVKKFITGLGKKVLIADVMAKTADSVFSVPGNRLDAPLSWIGIVAYALQIYFDFSGYSDMAIGLGRMFGFKIPENFNYPYISDSIKNFWERWHITLGLWLKTYLFLPIAYSVMRLTKRERIFKIKVESWAYLTGVIVTFTLCGLWHGAAWNFILWGLYFGILLALEHLGIRKRMRKNFPLPLRIVIAQFFILMGWVFFRSPDIKYSFIYLKVMFGGGADQIPPFSYNYFLDNEFLLTALAGIILSFPFYSVLKKATDNLNSTCPVLTRFVNLSGTVFYTIIFILSVMAVSTGTYKAFIYSGF